MKSKLFVLCFVLMGLGASAHAGTVEGGVAPVVEDQCNGADATLAGQFCKTKDMDPDVCCDKLASKVCAKSGSKKENCYYRVCNAIANGGTMNFDACLKAGPNSLGDLPQMD